LGGRGGRSEAIEAARTGGSVEPDPARTQKARQTLRSAMRDVEKAIENYREAAGPTPRQIDADRAEKRLGAALKALRDSQTSGRIVEQKDAPVPPKSVAELRAAFRDYGLSKLGEADPAGPSRGDEERHVAAQRQR
jgi:hypothetical protein